MNAQKTKNIFLTLVAFLFFYLCNHLIGTLMFNSKGIGTLFSPSTFPFRFYFDLPVMAISLIVLGISFLAYHEKNINKKKYRVGKEYGSARWGEKKDILPYENKVKRNNIILTESESLNFFRPDLLKYDRNKNVVVIGGSGSGKTRFFVKPNLMQLHSSYVVTDPKGTLILETGQLFQKAGYDIKVFNTIDFEKSMHYNPFSYLKNEKDIMTLVNVLILNTKGEGPSSGNNKFWEDAERLLYYALIGYMFFELPKEEHTFRTLSSLLKELDLSGEEDSVKQTDILFRRLEAKNPSHFAVLEYQKFKMAARETAQSIAISCGVRLAPFDVGVLDEITSYDELDIDSFSRKDKKTILYAIMSDSDTTFNFLLAILYTQMFNRLLDIAYQEGGKLYFPIRFMLDEFSNIGKIPDFDKLIAVIRSRNISANVILQTRSQLKAIYKDSCETILGNCDSSLFLGGKEESTLKSLSENLGKETIDIRNLSENYSAQKSMNASNQKMARALMTPDELSVMENDLCICQIRGVHPFKSKKYDVTKHPNYKYLSDYNPKNTFDDRKFIETLRKKRS